MSEDIYKKIFSKNLLHYMEINNKSQIDLINDLKFDKSTVSTWVNGTRLPRMDKVEMLAKYFGVNRSDLIEDKSYKSNKTVRAVRIPVYGHVAAGIPLEMIEDIIDMEEIPEEMAHGGEFFGLQIKGDSMEPKITNGDVVIVRRQEDAESGEIVIATINGSEATCKRLYKYMDGITLMSTNPVYDPMQFTNKEIMEKPVRIIGKVVELRAKF